MVVKFGGNKYRLVVEMQHRACIVWVKFISKLAGMVYFMLTRGEAFVDHGQQRYEEQQRQRSIAAMKRRAAAPGFKINPTPVPA